MLENSFWREGIIFCFRMSQYMLESMFLIISLIFIENKCLYDAIWGLKRERKKKVRPIGQRRDRTTGRSRQKDHDTRFNICATGADASADSAVLLLVLPLPWLTDVSSSQQWVIYSQTNGAVSNYTYLFRFVWFVIVFSDLLFCFWICHCVFWLVIMFSELLLCFLNCYFVFYICICVVICYFVFWIVICFALLGHRSNDFWNYNIVMAWINYI